MYMLIIGLATTFAVYNILRMHGVFETSTGSKKAILNKGKSDKVSSKRKLERLKLGVYSDLSKYLGVFFVTPTVRETHDIYISRLQLRSKVLNRLYTVEEYRGKYLLFLLSGLMVLPLFFINPLFILYTITTVFVFFSYPFSLDKKILAEDQIIDDNFMDLYLNLYPKLKMGSKARLAPSVESYVYTLERMGRNIQQEVMLKFSQTLLNNLSMYEDHVALPKLREKYTSATIVNFCNVATQSLQGIDNSDTLITFKMDLVNKRTTQVEERNKKIVSKGQMSINLIYVILVVFVLVGWYSKLPTGMF